MVFLVSIAGDVLQGGKLPLLVVERQYQPPVAGYAGDVRLNPFPLQIRVLCARRCAVVPNVRHRLGDDFGGAGAFGVAPGLRLFISPVSRYPLVQGEFAPHLCAPVLCKSRLPVTERPGGYPVRVDYVPARFVAGLPVRVETVNPSVDADGVGRIQPGLVHRLQKLDFGRRRLGRLDDPRPVDYFCKISHPPTSLWACSHPAQMSTV